jgi:hypothetical protein
MQQQTEVAAAVFLSLVAWSSNPEGFNRDWAPYGLVQDPSSEEQRPWRWFSTACGMSKRGGQRRS